MKRSKVSLSHSHLLDGEMGYLIPIGLFEVLPGDTVQQATSVLVRTNPLVAPVMHPVNVRIHHWFVPYRIIWDDFEKFITGGETNQDATVRPHVRLTAAKRGEVGIMSLADYFGLKPGPQDMVNALPFRAMAKIYNECYRDQDLQSAVGLSTASGEDNTTNLDLLRSSWEKDYFTTCRPWPQKGSDVVIPIAGTAPVSFNIGDKDVRVRYEGGALNTSVDLQQNGGYDAITKWNMTTNPTVTAPAQVFVPGFSGTGEADLSMAGAIPLDALRLGISLQHYAEARARYGSRFTEYLRYLGVKPSDARLQDPEYLGGGRQTIQFSEVMQTGPDSEDGGVGNLKGHGMGALRSNRYRKFFEEHGIVLSLLSVVPKTIYVQGREKMWDRATRFDYWQKEMEHIGQQEVYTKEVYDEAPADEVFGYQDRDDSYRRKESRVSGNFRNSNGNYWHFGRVFATKPALNSDFVTCTPTKRCFADQVEPAIQVFANHSIQARRLLSASGAPGLRRI